MENGKPIPTTWKTLGGMIKDGTVQVEVMNASASHRRFLGTVREEDLPPEPRRTVSYLEAQDAEQETMALYDRALDRGDTVYDRDRKKRGTIVRELNARADDNSRRFEIVDSEGNAWKQKESRLKKK